ncbi:MAG TPA: cysteine desulfurase [Euryarchaeota archaeon]|nr:cysteine desulfurase [Euryarchaeota archaeon]
MGGGSDYIYLDHASMMPVDPRVIEFARELLRSPGNPASLHSAGLAGKQAVEDAREKVADLINAKDPRSVIFTGSVTEANNLAIRGVSTRNMNRGKKVAASAIEHISVLNSMKELQKSGFEFSMIPVDSAGLVDVEALKGVVSKDTVVTSIMHGNNEIGTVEPIKDLAKAVHDLGIYIHVDAAASAGRIPIDVQADDIDLLTLSSNDLNGPQGAGALYVKPGIRLQPIILGGGQEKGLRSGTENLFALAGMGEASRIAKEEMSAESDRLKRIRDGLIEEIMSIEGAHLTGHPTERLPHHASFRFGGIEGESIQLNMNNLGIAVSTGSACSSITLEPSHVLLAIGLKHEEAHGSMVMTLGRSNDIGQVPRIADAVKETVTRLRGFSPLGAE